jgi:hypothetical protein
MGGCAASTIRREARRNPRFGRWLQRSGMRADLEPLQAVHRASDKHWRAAAWLVNQPNAQRSATQETRNLKLWKLNEFAKNVRWMLMGAIRDADVLADVLGLLDQEIAKANGKPPTPQQVAQRKRMEIAEHQIRSLPSSSEQLAATQPTTCKKPV